jgi:hypothetical protein
MTTFPDLLLSYSNTHFEPVNPDQGKLLHILLIINLTHPG